MDHLPAPSPAPGVSKVGLSTKSCLPSLFVTKVLPKRSQAHSFGHSVWQPRATEEPSSTSRIFTLQRFAESNLQAAALCNKTFSFEIPLPCPHTAGIPDKSAAGLELVALAGSQCHQTGLGGPFLPTVKSPSGGQGPPTQSAFNPETPTSDSRSRMACRPGHLHCGSSGQRQAHSSAAASGLPFCRPPRPGSVKVRPSASGARGRSCVRTHGGLEQPRTTREP